MASYLEIACFNPASVRIAASSGADRVEFCAGAAVGGTTPSLDDFLGLRAEIRIPMYVMIRPSGGSFVYTDGEFDEMKRDLSLFRDAGADGFVFGILNSEAEPEVDVQKCGMLVALADGKSCTFHRAFDELHSPQKMASALSDVEKCGFENVLTSGGKESAVKGSLQLEGLVAQSASNKLNIIVGGGVRSGNVEELRRKTGARWFHSSAVVDGGETASELEVKALRNVLDGKSVL